MKLKYNFIINEVAGKMVAVAVGDDIDNFNGFVKTNAIGAEVLELLKNDITIEEITKKLSDKYSDTDAKEIESGVKDFIDGLKAEGVIEE